MEQNSAQYPGFEARLAVFTGRLPPTRGSTGFEDRGVSKELFLQRYAENEKCNKNSYFFFSVYLHL